MDKIQNIRDLARPFLTALFSSSLVICVIMSLCKLLKQDDFDLKSILALIALISTPLGTIMGYHFGKISQRGSHDIKP